MINVVTPSSLRERNTRIIQRRYMDTLWNLRIAKQLVAGDFKIRFRQTLLGLGWFVLPIILTFGISFASTGGSGNRYTSTGGDIFMRTLVGVTLWQLFTTTCTEPLRLVRRNRGMLLSFSSSGNIFLLAGAMSSILSFLFQSIPLFVIVFTSGREAAPVIYGLLLGAPAIVLAGAALACLMLPASLGMLDVRYGVPYLNWSLLFATPIFYEVHNSGIVGFVNRWNPMWHIVRPTIDLIDGKGLAPRNLAVGYLLAITFICTAEIYLRIKFRKAMVTMVPR